MLGQQNFSAPSPGRLKMHQKCWRPILGIFLSTKPAGLLFYCFWFLLGFFFFHLTRTQGWSPVKAVPCTARLAQAFGHWLHGIKFKNHWELWKKTQHLTVSSYNLGEHCNEIFSILIPGEFWDGLARNKGVERSSSVIAFQTDSFSLSPLQLQSKSFPKNAYAQIWLLVLNRQMSKLSSF